MISGRNCIGCGIQLTPDIMYRSDMNSHTYYCRDCHRKYMYQWRVQHRQFIMDMSDEEFAKLVTKDRPESDLQETL